MFRLMFSLVFFFNEFSLLRSVYSFFLLSTFTHLLSSSPSTNVHIFTFNKLLSHLRFSLCPCYGLLPSVIASSARLPDSIIAKINENRSQLRWLEHHHHKYSAAILIFSLILARFSSRAVAEIQCSERDTPRRSWLSFMIVRWKIVNHHWTDALICSLDQIVKIDCSEKWESSREMKTKDHPAKTRRSTIPRAEETFHWSAKINFSSLASRSGWTLVDTMIHLSRMESTEHLLSLAAYIASFLMIDRLNEVRAKELVN